MNSISQTKLMAYLVLAILFLSAVCLILGATLGILLLTAPEDSSPTDDLIQTNNSADLNETNDTATSTEPRDVMLSESTDAGMSYIDSMIFFGESTTAHLRSRGVLSDGKDTLQVWANSSGTMMLSSQMLASKCIDYPPTGQTLSITEACEAEQPKYIVLSFGLNGISEFIKNKSGYVNNYNKLINKIHTASPDTKIILQTVYPVCRADDYTMTEDELNTAITTLNSWLPEIAAAHEFVRVVDTASVLRDENGWLKQSYDNGDGIHLTASAYTEILAYLRTHAWQ